MEARNKRKFTRLVFSGGGAAGFGYVDVAKALDEEKDYFSFDDVKEVLGTSVGSIAALLFALKYTPEEISNRLSNMNLEKFEDGGILPTEISHFLTQYGMYKGEALHQFIKSFLKEKLGNENATFRDLKEQGFKNLYVVTTKIHFVNDKPIGKKKVFSYETHADTSIADAILASTAAPPFFPAVPLKKVAKGKYIIDPEGDLYVDGGISDNYDIDFFDTRANDDEETLGFVLLNSSEMNNEDHKPKKSRITHGHPIHFLIAIFNTLYKGIESQHLDSERNRARTIQIDRKGVSFGDFDMSKKTKEALIASGPSSVKSFFNGLRHEDSHDHMHEEDKRYATKSVPHGEMWEQQGNDESKVLSKKHTTHANRCVVA